jgi:pentatricopeptide repeat protein
MDLATALIWTLRILLPVILFCIYFKLQSPKDEQQETSSGVRFTREKLLARRKATMDCPVPEALAEIAMKDQSQAPTIFGSGRSGGGGKGGKQRERGERGDRGERGEKREKGDNKRTDRSIEQQAPEDPIETEATQSAQFVTSPVVDTKMEKMQVETLVNFVAFNQVGRQQRVFLPDTEGGPPPPPPPRPAANGESVTGEKAEKANIDAQMVLRGSIKFERAEVTTLLYEQLSDQSVEITEATFTLMIEACLRARELKLASDFLLKMENAGFCPDSELLDKVMDLYSIQKSQREREKQAQAEAEAQMAAEGNLAMLFPPVPSVDDALDGSRAKLSSEAAVFVPSFAESKLSMNALPFVPITGDEPTDRSVEAPAPDEGTRTKLKATSKPFEPQLNLSFDPYMYTWTAGDDQVMEADQILEEPAQAKGGSKKGKGKGKSTKEGGKGKDKGSGKEDGTKESKPKAKAKAKEKSAQNEASAGDKSSAKPKWKAKEAA